MMHGTQTAPPAALAVSGLSHFYGRRKALDDVTFAIAPATFTVLLGLNGAGKSTLFSLVTRLFATRQGSIRIFGHDIGQAPGEALRVLGVVFQPRTLDLDLSVMQNLMFYASLHGIRAREARVRAQAVLATIELSARAGDKVRDLSGGQVRRVEIARALLHRPRLLVLDEPTVGLDIKARAAILEHVRALAAAGTCVLWATHLVDEIADGDDVAILHAGRILAHGPVARVVGEAGAPNIHAAFTRLTGGAETQTSDGSA
ncbi:MAG TPA: ABC transporter ATP-binding protein [Xanthobacteraceae bacterium]|nr:ABC transporter ATP-binding protein [Xanthobacteraceae bacterium]